MDLPLRHAMVRHETSKRGQVRLEHQRSPRVRKMHRRVREADRTHGRCNTTALAICLKYRE